MVGRIKTCPYSENARFSARSLRSPAIGGNHCRRRIRRRNRLRSTIWHVPRAADDILTVARFALQSGTQVICAPVWRPVAGVYLPAPPVTRNSAAANGSGSDQPRA